jgi:hypothetical protein
MVFLVGVPQLMDLEVVSSGDTVAGNAISHLGWPIHLTGERCFPGNQSSLVAKGRVIIDKRRRSPLGTNQSLLRRYPRASHFG